VRAPQSGIVPGIEVDRGAKALAGGPEARVTAGLAQAPGAGRAA